MNPDTIHYELKIQTSFSFYMVPKRFHFKRLKFLKICTDGQTLFPDLIFGMLIYSKTSQSFLKRVKAYARDIIINEMGLSMGTKRIRLNDYLYPINFVVFEGQPLGYFSPQGYRIGLNKNLMYTAKETIIKDVIRHELAHFICFARFRDQGPSHGDNFKAICDEFSFSKDIARATLHLERANDKLEGDLQSEKLISRIQKLLSLASSSNSYESEAATLKANQLLLRHNLEYINKDKEQTYYIKPVLESKRVTPKVSAIYDILTYFMVTPVINNAKGHVTIEVTGERANVILAQYVADFLNEELEKQWSQSGLKGISQKKSFMQGIAQGYSEKMDDSKRSYNREERKALTTIKENTELISRGFYGRLGGRTTTHKNSAENMRAQRKGKSVGKNLSIRRPLTNNKKGIRGLLN